MNPDMTMAITPTHLCLTPEYNNSNIMLETVRKRIQGNFMQCEKTVIPPGATLNIEPKSPLHSPALEKEV